MVALSVTFRAACVASQGISAATAWRLSSVTPVAGGATWRTSAHRPGCLTVVSAGIDKLLSGIHVTMDSEGYGV